MIDSHCHLLHPQFDADRETVVQAALAAGVRGILAVADTLESARAGAEFVRGREGLWASAGVHPHHAAQWTADSGAQLRELLALPELVALGEIGLDYHYDFAPRPQQQRALEAQLALARATGRPVILHNRESDRDLIALLRATPPPAGVMHCFTGDGALMEQALELGLHISFAGVLTFKRSAALRELARAVPADRLLIETDAPYLAPEPHRGRRNQPALLPYTLEVLARSRDQSREELGAQLSANFERLFLTRRVELD
ncbi:MAG TPA: TatD family hydrolase [Acidobacteriota bacterium]